MTALLVALGGAAGAAGRLVVMRALPGSRATLAVNVLGSLLLGLRASAAERPYALLGIGLCGAFTTFSAFALDAVELPRRACFAYVVGSVVLCCLACAVGLAVA